MTGASPATLRHCRAMDVELPPALLEHLRGRVRQIWGATKDDPATALAALPRALPPGEVVRAASGGAFGWLLDCRLDELDGRLALEVLEDSRMSGPSHYRVWEDGTREELPTVQTMMVFPADATADQRAEVERAYFAHNAEVGRLLRARGFR